MSNFDTSKIYYLEFLIKGENLNKEQLESKLQPQIEKFKSKLDNYEEIDIKVENYHNDPGLFKIWASGKFNSIDYYYDYISKKTLKNYKFIRLRDDLGEEIRETAFPILALIEQKIRVFIGEKLFVIGSDLDNLILAEEGENIDQKTTDRFRQAKKALNDNNDLICYSLEKTTLDQLLVLITIPLRRWKRKVDVEELKGVISKANTIDEISEELNRKTKEYSVLSIIMKSYLNLSEEEINSKINAFNKFINIIIPIRNAVMHHRPLRYKDFKCLKQYEEEIIKFIRDFPETPLNIERANEAKQQIENIKPSLYEFLQRPLELTDLVEKIRAMYVPDVINQQESNVVKSFKKTVEKAAEIQEEKISPDVDNTQDS